MRMIVAALLLVLCCATGALAWAGEMKPPAYQSSNWPSGLADLLNSRKWVYAYWGNFGFERYYYSGDAKAFNEFVDKFAKLGTQPRLDTDWGEAAGLAFSDKAPPQLILHSGREMTGGFDVKEDAKIAFEWRVEMSGGGVRSEDKVVPHLDLWTGGNVKLAEVKVPLNVVVRADHPATPEITKFIADHEAKRTADKQ